jgi:methyltransferase family protein
MADDYRALLKQAALDEAAFVQMTLKGKIGDKLPWRMVVVRPVLLKNQRHLQFSHFDAKQDITKNYAGSEAEAHLDELLVLPFSSVHLRSTDEDVQVQITRKGKALIHREVANQHRQPELSHDAPKALPIPADHPDPFLQTIGIMTGDGRVRADMQDKFAQINQFLTLLDHTRALESFDHSPLHVLDCGCGSSQLSFSVYHYLNHIWGIPATLDGVDVNAKLMDKSNGYSRELGLNDVCFYASSIINYQPQVPPDIVIALHACDTATDEALAMGIGCGAGIIMAAPCCHHDLNEQLEARPPFQPVVRHGILKERLADILTDSFRALILRIMGYKTDVVEFVSSDHTGRNLLIRAVKRGTAGDPAALREYEELKSYWGVTPYLEKLLGENFGERFR